jgi:uncharacterized protein YegL
MSGDPINELNQGVKLFFESIKADEIAQWAADICVVEFNDQAKKVLDFDSVHKQTVPYLSASGCTAMAQGVNTALDLLEQRKNEFQRFGVDYYQPWMVLMTDGEPTDSPFDIEKAAQRACELIENRKLTIFPIGIGQGANMNQLKKFSPKRPPLRLKGLNFADFFEWLSASVQRVSQSTPGEKIELDFEGIKAWGEL